MLFRESLRKTSWLLLMGLMVSGLVSAHNMGEGAHLVTRVDAQQQLSWQLEITLNSLITRFEDFDRDQNGRISADEHANIDIPRVTDYALKHLQIQADEQPCEIKALSAVLVQVNTGDYLDIPLHLRCEVAKPQHLSVDYGLFFAENPYHQGTWTLLQDKQPIIYYFWEDERQRSHQLNANSSLLQVMARFLIQGIHHILIGYDHLLFLLSLLLTVVLTRVEGHWQAVAERKVIFFNVLKVVTLFTLAHSITLSCAVLGWVKLPPASLVESLIALSILLLALHNIRPWLGTAVLPTTFAFGLIHGFGFASVLLEYGLPTSSLVASLLSFNLGVELGQIAALLMVLPLLLLLRKTTFYQCYGMPLLSLVIALVAGYWFFQRAMQG